MDFFQAQVKDITSIAVSSKLGENTALLCNFGEPFDVHPIRGSGGALMFSSDFKAREVFVENLHDPMQWGNPEWEFTGAIDAISKGIASERSVGNARFRRRAQTAPFTTICLHWIPQHRPLLWNRVSRFQGFLSFLKGLKETFFPLDRG